MPKHGSVTGTPSKVAAAYAPPTVEATEPRTQLRRATREASGADGFEATDLDSPRAFKTSLNLHDFSEGAVPPLTFEPYGMVTERAARKIRALAEQLESQGDRILLLRGQKFLEERVSKVSTDPAHRQRAVDSALRAGTHTLDLDLETQRRYRVMSQLAGAKHLEEHDRLTQIIESATPLDGLAKLHVRYNGHPCLVSTSRSLRIAAGAYSMRRLNNDNRYILLLSVPEDRALNIHAFQTNQAAKVLLAEAENADRQNHHLKFTEHEIAVWLDATPFVRAVYDAKDERFLAATELPQALQDNLKAWPRTARAEW